MSVRPSPARRSFEEVLEGVAQVVHRVTERPADQVRPERLFVDDLLVDSLAMVEILEGTAQHFGVRIEDEAAKQLLRVGDLVDYVQHAG